MPTPTLIGASFKRLRDDASRSQILLLFMDLLSSIYYQLLHSVWEGFILGRSEWLLHFSESIISQGILFPNGFQGTHHGEAPPYCRELWIRSPIFYSDARRPHAITRCTGEIGPA
ncbi:hypothetical protein KSP39_PZI008009 [Platanthera zijinensis]|uniref:Uncharacterized protein n=1 Tax=Platanthera zijinensis TaxID=2320716 RepID=A0AAP0G8H5_9ASPA